MDDRPALRYADCPTAEADVLVDATAEALWPLVSDIHLPARFSEEFAGADWLDGATGAGLGARFVGRNAHDAIGSWETVCTISAFEPCATFEWTVGDIDHPSSAWRYTLRPEGSGTRLGMWMRMGPARSGINMAIDSMPDKESRILYRRLAEHRANMERTLLGIKELAESGAG
ncbi:MAG: SRPBCC family protein [Ilumatobacteraceae bacterium]